MARYTFDKVKAAIREAWGFQLRRPMRPDARYDGRWDASYSRTGLIVSGNRPGRGYGHWRYRSLAHIVRVYELEGVIATLRGAA